MATQKVQEQPKVESPPAPQPETAPASASPETPEEPEVQASTPAPEQGQDPRPGDGQGPSRAKAVLNGRADAAKAADDTPESSASTAPVEDEQGGDAQDAPYSEMRDGIGGGVTGWVGQGEEQDAGNQDAIVQLEDGDGDKSESSFDAVAAGGGIGAGLLGLTAAHAEDEFHPGDSHEAPRPAVRRSRRPKPIQDDDEERAHRAAVELGRRGGIKSGQARRIRSQKINPPQMQPASAPPEPAKRRKRPYWFKPPRLPGQRA